MTGFCSPPFTVSKGGMRRAGFAAKPRAHHRKSKSRGTEGRDFF
jgi:hypothetical protein